MAERFVTYETENPGMLVDPDGTMRPVVMIINNGFVEPYINVTFDQLYSWLMPEDIRNLAPIIVLLAYSEIGFGGGMKPLEIQFDFTERTFNFIDSDRGILYRLTQSGIARVNPV